MPNTILCVARLAANTGLDPELQLRYIAIIHLIGNNPTAPKRYISIFGHWLFPIIGSNIEGTVSAMRADLFFASSPAGPNGKVKDFKLSCVWQYNILTAWHSGLGETESYM